MLGLDQTISGLAKFGVGSRGGSGGSLVWVKTKSDRRKKAIRASKTTPCRSGSTTIIFSNSLSTDVIVVLFVLLQGVSDEESKTSPWTYIAKYKLMVEEELSKLDGYEIKLVSHRVLVFKE